MLDGNKLEFRESGRNSYGIVGNGHMKGSLLPIHSQGLQDMQGHVRAGWEATGPGELSALWGAEKR